MRIIFVGFGVVGQSIAKVLEEKKEELIKIYGVDPKTVAVVDSGGAAIDPQGLDLDVLIKLKESGVSVATYPDCGYRVRDALGVIREVEADVMLETTPTNIADSSLGISNIETALKFGMNVVTTNKGPLARAMPALMEIAAYNGVELKFSGTVGGGTPILEVAKKCLLGDRILSIRGVLNGTTNYILTCMSDEKASMEEALRDAQRLGYAESDPSYDLDGVDAAVKLVIIANWIMDMGVSIDDVEVQGIRCVTLKDVEDAKRGGEVIKLVGSVGGDLSVKPQRIQERDPLNVGGTLNAASFTTELSGVINLVGKGAGGVETASAALRDLIDIKNHLSYR